MQLAHFFKSENYQITITSTADKSTVDLSQFEGITLVPVQLNDDSFNAFVSDLNPDLVLFDRFIAEEQFGWRVAENVPNAIRILDTEDLHSLRNTRREAFKKGIAFSERLWLQNDLTKREIASIYRCDLSLIISTYEMQLLRSVIKNPELLLLHLPFMLDALDGSTIDKWMPFDVRKDFVFIGFGGHAPNIDAISYIKNEIWPKIRMALPSVNINIYGGNLSSQINAMHHPKEGFLVKGWAESSEKVISSARVMLAPLRFGAGIKGKLVAAMQYGTPSVTTKIGSEGMHGNLNWNGKIGYDAKTLAEAALALYQHGITLVNTLYQKEKLEKPLRAKLQMIGQDLQKHRDQNFIGAMLLQDTMQSKKYLSKWIAAKNRSKKEV